MGIYKALDVTGNTAKAISNKRKMRSSKVPLPRTCKMNKRARQILISDAAFENNLSYAYQ